MGMKPQEKVSPRREMKIVVDRNDPRSAAVKCDGKTVFVIKTDVSGVHPSVIVTATETYLKTMIKGKAGIALWNGPAGIPPRNLKLPT